MRLLRGRRLGDARHLDGERALDATAKDLAGAMAKASARSTATSRATAEELATLTEGLPPGFLRGAATSVAELATAEERRRAPPRLRRLS